MIRGFWPKLLICAVLLLSGCDQFTGRMEASKGYRAYLDRKYAEAIESYEAARDALPGNITILKNLSYAYFAAAHDEKAKEKVKPLLDKAIAILTELTKQFPKDTELLGILIDAWEQGQHLEQAAKFFENRLAQTPKDIDALRALAVIQLRRGNYDAALDALEKRKELSPDDMGLSLSIAQVTWQYLRVGGPAEDKAAVTLATKAYEFAMEANKREPKNYVALTYANLILRERAKRQTNPDDAKKDEQDAEELYKKVRALQTGESNVKP